MARAMLHKQQRSCLRRRVPDLPPGQMVPPWRHPPLAVDNFHVSTHFAVALPGFRTRRCAGSSASAYCSCWKKTFATRTDALIRTLVVDR